jgi:integrase
LTALSAQRERRPGMHADGRGLYLRISPYGARSWIFRYMLHGRRHDFGLGSADAVTLAQARQKAQEARSLCAAGVSPVDAKRERKAAARAAAAKVVTFRDAAASYIAAHRIGWRNLKHAGQWEATLADYVFPVIGALPVGAVDTGLVLKVLEPIWTTKTETASRVRGRIESILDWAKVRGFRDRENPARWRGHLDKLLPRRAKVRKAQHHAALPYRDMPAFLAELRERNDDGARALEFTILTAARTGEVVGATPGEFDKIAAVWTIPASRMKADHEHRVPLSAPALVLVDAVTARRGAGHIMLRVMSKLRPGFTVHGFRSTFRDWAAECTNFPSEVVEMALAHTIGNAVEAAYRRGDLFEKRRALMQEWGSFCAQQTADLGAAVVLTRAAARVQTA